MNEMVGPILFKLALDARKETRAPAPSLDDCRRRPPAGRASDAT